MSDVLKRYALSRIPRLLGSIDANPCSSTYGCMDRLYWHYKKADFPSGMHQLGSLALAYAYLLPDSPWKNDKRIKELCVASIRYMERCSHPDGSCDEFYPFERALGATAFTLYAGTEAYRLLRLQDKAIVAFFRKRADWLMNHDEPSVIANHLFGSALALANTYLITMDSRYLRAAKAKVKKAMAWQSEEGWFMEYAGCDPGYMTFTVDFLSKYHARTKDRSVLPAINRAIDFCSYFMHPDGSYGGIYGSRSTSHFMPFGFEISGDKGRSLVDKHTKALTAGLAEAMDDDIYYYYQLNNYLETSSSYKKDRRPLMEPRQFVKHFSDARLLVFSNIQDGRHIYGVISTAKGVCKFFADGKLIYSDTGYIGLSDRGIITSQAHSDNVVQYAEGSVEVSGDFCIVRENIMTPVKQAMLRAFNMTAGRSFFLSSLFKRALVKRLITGTKRAGIRFVRRFTFEGKLSIEDQLTVHDERTRIHKIWLGKGFSTLYVPTSRYYEPSTLGLWKEIKPGKRMHLYQTII